MITFLEQRKPVFSIRRLRSVRQLLGRDVTIQLVVALVFSRLDYCNAVLAGLPVTTLAQLQRAPRRRSTGKRSTTT